MTLYDVALAPFAEFGFMRRTLVGCLALALSCGPIVRFRVNFPLAPANTIAVGKFKANSSVPPLIVIAVPLALSNEKIGAVDQGFVGSVVGAAGQGERAAGEFQVGGVHKGKE